MAEATLEAVTEETPPNDAALTTPEPVEETAPEAETQEEDYTELLKGFLAEDSDEPAGDGKGAPADGEVPALAEKPLTPDEIRAEERRKVEAEAKQRSDAAAQRAYIDGVNRSFQQIDSELDTKADEWGLSSEQRQWLRGRFQAHNGHWNVLHKYALEQGQPQVYQQAYGEAEAQVSRLLFDAITEDLGESSVKSIQKDLKTWPDLAKAITKEARKGYVPQEKVSDARKELAKRIDTALKERGMSLADLTGNGRIDLPPARGGSRGMTLAQFEKLSLDEQLKVPADERARIYAAAQRR